jgi:hypothetical protein
MNCYLRYLEEEDRFRAEASLTEQSENGSNVAVEIPGGIQYAGKDMTLLGVQGMTYFAQGQGDFSANQPFTWKNEKGEAQEFVLSPSPITAFGFAEKTVNRNSPGNFSWRGDPLGKGEALFFLWQNPKTGATTKMDIISSNAASQIEIPAAKLSQLTPGKWTLYVVRRKMTKSEVGNIPVTGISEYYSKTDTLEVQ